ncbi:ferrous iron transport protein B [Tissierella pigra]|uniref:Ferrous iron transport protein B n=1 Tax=Tissierella pigra TaxID=2607614 RepID=A0A6N7XKX1_9FIRM|nr:ferrous iron transport protein B [Tissierella pigra]MBU5424827.1 ferrous iron transport protein B [Tissierella pigra]MSU02226.1 ferrous iron transport protein B [Tissierella pigra]
MDYVIALAGNPNSGKTTLFNELTGSKQHVGNWPGVTVDKKEGVYKKDKNIKILDLPGTYSLSPYSAEEIIARDYIVKNKPDVVINIVDGTNIERNLYLTLQIAETKIPMVVAMNMMDEVESQGDKIDCEKLKNILGVPVIPIVARNGKGLDKLMAEAVKVAKDKPLGKKLEVFDENISNAVNAISELLIESNNDSSSVKAISTEAQWKAIKLVENDEIVSSTLSDNKRAAVEKIVREAEKNADGDTEAKIADLRYQFITKTVNTAVKKSKKGYVETKSDKIDKILTNRFLALPIFAIIMYLMFAITFSENFLLIEGLPSPGVWLAGLAEGLWGSFADVVDGLIANASPVVYSLIMDGVIEGLGAIIGFIPLVWVLYLLISFLEDCGYMARIAFVMDRIFRRFGLSGRSFIPLLMGFGCGVPAVMATRTLDSEKDRTITTIITAFMPCGAKLPIFAMFVSTFFAGNNKTLVTYSLYMLSIVVAIVVSLILNKFVYKSATSNFVMELPRYRVPTIKSIAIHGWEKVKGFAVKAGTVIFISTILIWLLSNFNINSFNGVNAANNEDGVIMAEMDDSFLASVGNAVAPVFKPLGFGEWRPTVGVATGWIAKEMVVVTLAQLYDDDVSPEYLEGYFSQYNQEELEELGFEDGQYDEEAAFDIYTEGILWEGEDENALSTMKDDIKTKAAAYSYMVFNLLCMPCFAAVGATKRELKSWKLTGAAVGTQMLTAYIVAFVVYTVGSLIA